jgi:hypothetical protein
MADEGPAPGANASQIEPGPAIITGILGGYHPLKPVVEGWIERFRRAREMREPWQDVADECEMFYGGAPGFLWDPRFRQKLWGINHGALNPTFAVHLAKAFELVALIGPALYWRNPERTATPRGMVQPPPQMFGDPSSNPQAAQAMQQIGQMVQQEMTTRSARAQLMETALNYGPLEYKLYREGELAVNDGLISGRGVLFTEPYLLPGSQRRMIGSFRCNPRDFFIDPDAERLDHGWWIARRTWQPKWRVARLWNIPREVFESAGIVESVEQQSQRRADMMANIHEGGLAQEDLLEVWEVWSKMGVGVRQKAIKTPIKRELEQAVGDYAHLTVCAGVPFPLNMPTDRFVSATVQEVRKAFEWPYPTWAEGKWPCSVLDFYPHPRHAYPVPPMSPGLGELKAMNVIFSHVVSRTWKSCRDFITVLESARKNVEGVLAEGKDLDFLVLDDAMYKNINEVVQILQFPPANKDIWEVIDRLAASFDRRVGLSEIYAALGQAGSPIRSATDSDNRQRTGSIRTNGMAMKVEQWQADCAKLEAFGLKWFVQAHDVEDYMGPIGARMWDQYIAQAPVERLLRDIDYSVAANSARWPNKDRDLANINDAMQITMPAVQMYTQMTQDFGPLQWLLQQWGKLAEQDMSGLVFRPPQANPQQAMQQQQLQIMAQKAQAQQQLAAQKAQQDFQLRTAQVTTEQQRRAESHQLRMVQKAQEHQLGMGVQRDRLFADVAQTRLGGAATLLQAQAGAEAKLLGARAGAAAKLEVADAAAEAKRRAHEGDGNGKPGAGGDGQ